MNSKEVTVFSRLREALADAEREEVEFAEEVTEGEPDGKLLYQAYLEWTNAVFESAQSLSVTPEMKRIFERELASAVDEGSTTRNVAELPFVKPLLELALARNAVDRLEKGTSRFFKLLDSLIDVELQPIAQGYFSSVARLYIWGFNNEAVVLARSALDSALADRLNQEEALISPSTDSESLAARIHAAGPKGIGILNSAGVTYAETLRKAGNHALHVQLGSQRIKALDAIKALGHVLGQLFPKPGA